MASASNPGPSTSSSSRPQVEIAQKTWEMANNVHEVAASEDIYKYDRAQQQSMLVAKPWDKDPNLFKEIKISALALLKMVMHSRSGGNLEVMGLLLGKELVVEIATLLF